MAGNSKVILLNNTSEDPNWGCQATSSELKLLLKRHFSSLEEVNISFCSSFKERLSGHLKMWALYFNVHSIFQFITPVLKFYFIYISWNRKIYRGISDSNAVALNGEGTIHVFNRAVAKWMHYVIVAKLVFKKKVVIVNHTYQVDVPNVIKITKFAYGLADKIFVREPNSLPELDKLCIDSTKVSVVPDAAFMKKPNNNTVEKISGRYFCICGNVKINDEQLQVLIGLIEFVCYKYDLVPVFMSADKTDEKLFSLIKDRVNSLVHFENKNEVQDAINIIDRAELFITGRFHPFIFSLSTSTPTLTYKSNTFKIEGVKKMIGINEETTSIELLYESMDKNKASVTEILLLPKEKVDIDTLRDCIIESYCAELWN